MEKNLVQELKYKKENNMIKAVVWDIGGVILYDIDIGDFWKEISESKKIRNDYGTNKINFNEFVSKGAKLLGLQEDEFIKKYKDIYSFVKPIKETYKIYLNMKTAKYILSDTNKIHADFVARKRPEIFKSAKKRYLSYEIGMRKDIIETFNYVIKDLKLLPSEILFIDDKKPHIDLAKKAGMNAIHYINPEQLKAELNKLNVK
jgi:FMN phosphatase YigB (HAD superfamily)